MSPLFVHFISTLSLAIKTKKNFIYTNNTSLIRHTIPLLTSINLIKKTKYYNKKILLYINPTKFHSLTLLSKPSRTLSVSHSNINITNYKVTLLTTSHGLLLDHQAIHNKVGGIPLFQISYV